MSKNQSNNGEKQQPAKVIRLGKIKATVWVNETQIGKRHNTQIVKIYKEGDAWKETTSFGRDDLPLVAKVADLAHTFIFESTTAEE